MSDQRNFPVRAKNALDNRNISLSAPCPTAEKKWSSFSWKVINGNPRIEIYTNDPNDSGNDHGRIQVKMSAAVGKSILNAIKKSVDSAPDTKFTFEVEDYIYSRGGKSERPELQTRIAVGKDVQGLIYICVVDVIRKQRPKIKFVFKAPRFVKLSKNGELLEGAAESEYFAMVYHDVWSDLANHLMVSTYVEPKKREDGQGGGGGYNRGGQGGGNQGGGGYNNGGGAPAAAPAMDDDLPF